MNYNTQNAKKSTKKDAVGDSGGMQTDPDILYDTDKRHRL